MKWRIPIRPFSLGFALGIVLSVGLNYLTYRNRWCNENIYDCYFYVGFPVPFAIGQGGPYGIDGIIWFGLVVDIFFLLTASVLLGWIFAYIESKTRSRHD